MFLYTYSAMQNALSITAETAEGYTYLYRYIGLLLHTQPETTVRRQGSRSGVAPGRLLFGGLRTVPRPPSF